MLQVSNLTKSYPTPRGPLTVLSEVSFALAPGDAAAVMGPSGAGKSSLLYLLGALEPPSAGTVSLDGTNPFLLKPRELAAFRNASVGFVFQDHCLLPQCSVLENVLIPTLVAAPGGQPADRARELIDRVGLSDRIDHRPGELSGGERQRVAIARAVVGDRRLLLADEPTGALDSANGEAVMRLILTACKRGLGAVVVTHDAQLASWADRVVFIRDGRIVDRTAPRPGPDSLLAGEPAR